MAQLRKADLMTEIVKGLNTQTKHEPLEIVFKNSKQAFEDALVAGRLSSTEGTINYIGDYMYMGTKDGRDLFKHINTRRYLP